MNEANSLVGELKNEFGEDKVEYEVKLNPFETDAYDDYIRNDDNELILQYNDLNTIVDICERYDYKYEVNFTEKRIRVFK